jgi:hypothetical protein
MPVRSKEPEGTRPPFPAVTQIHTTAGITLNTSTMHPTIGAAHTSTSTSSRVPQTSTSIPTNHTCSSALGEYRSTIQTTVNKLRELMERFRTLSVEQPYHTYTIILPITQASRNGLLGREISIPGEMMEPAPLEDTQNAGGVG